MCFYSSNMCVCVYVFSTFPASASSHYFALENVRCACPFPFVSLAPSPSSLRIWIWLSSLKLSYTYLLIKFDPDSSILKNLFTFLDTIVVSTMFNFLPKFYRSRQHRIHSPLILVFVLRGPRRFPY